MGVVAPGKKNPVFLAISFPIISFLFNNISKKLNEQLILH